MSSTPIVKTYPANEERINICSHGLGLLLSLAACVALGIKSTGPVELLSTGVFALGLMALYASSTIYHSATDPVFRIKMRTVDHAMIYILIAATYTPFTLLVLPRATGLVILIISWSMAAIGITIKLFFTGRYRRLSTAMYVLMGWLIVFAIEPLVENLSTEGLTWLFVGGIAYTLGALFYSIHRLPFAHAIFHVFTLFGSISHFVALYYFVLPGAEKIG